MNLDYKAAAWVNANGTLGGCFAHLRKNITLLSVDSKEFPYLVLLSLLYQHKAPDGRPSDEEEWSRLDSTEERVADVLQEKCGACFALCVTRDGRRDLFFFMPTSVSDEAVDELIQFAEPSVDYEFSLICDPAWMPYHDLLPEPKREDSGRS